MFQTVLICVVIIVILLIAEYFLFYADSLKGFRKVPGIKRIPIIGNALFVICSPLQIFYLGRHIANVFRNKGNICRAQVIGMKIINFYDPDDMEALLSVPKNLQKGKFYDLVHPWLNDGLLTSKGEKWQKRRKIITTAFHFNILKQFVKIFHEESEKLVNSLQGEVGKSETEIHAFITKFSLNVISETAMGTNLDLCRSNVVAYKKAVLQMGELFITRVTRFWLQIPIIYKFTSHFKEEKRLLNCLHGFTTSVIRERRLTSDIKNTKEPNDNEMGIKQKMAMLDLLLKSESEGQIDEKGIREEVDTFMFAGHDTTSVAIIYTLMLLANNPEAQMLVLNEINDVLENSEQQLNIEDYNKMNYLEMCIKESLRLYPSVPVISRHLTEDLQLKNYLLPNGMMILIHIFDMHRNPNLYPDPDKFIPERFLPENIRNRHPYAYIPFSAGPRNCIGQKFALLQEKVVISAILRKFILEPITRHEDVIFVSNIVLKTLNPIKIKFNYRE